MADRLTGLYDGTAMRQRSERLWGPLAIGLCIMGSVLPLSAAPLDARLDPTYTPVVEQVFRIVVNRPPKTALTVTASPTLDLVDRSPAGAPGPVTRLYYRASTPVPNARVSIEAPGGETAALSFTVLSYRQDIDTHLQEVAGISPEIRKQGRSYYSERMVQTARDNLARHPGLAETISCSPELLQRTDGELWRSLPSWNVPRQCYSNWPCPKCGDTIFKTSGFYPWRRSADYPYRAQCPSCKQWFPSNDVLRDDYCSGPYADDGWGWDPGGGERAEAAGWVAYYNHHTVWRPLGDRLRRLSLAWLLTGDERAAHQAGVLLARLAMVYPGMNMRWQQVRPRYLRPGRILIDGNWERNEILVPALRAYDALWDYIGRDEALAAFLRAKEPTIQTSDDVRRLLDTCLVQLFAWDWMRRELSGGNQGAREEDFAQMIVCAGMPSLEDVWLRELFTHAYNSGSNRGGVDDECFINNLSREGATLVSGLGYALGYLDSKSDMAQILSRVAHPFWRGRCDLYDAQAYPKLREEYDLWLDLVCAGQFMPSYGDSGGARAARYRSGPAAAHRTAYRRAYRHWPTDRLAHAVRRAGPGKPKLFEPDCWEQAAAQTETAGEPTPLTSRIRDGIGFAILESRPGSADLDERAAVALRYGYALGHHHQDNLNIEFWAHGDVVIPELGYPCWAHPMGNTSFVAHHATGMIDHLPQYDRGTGKGALEGFAQGKGVSFVDVSATPAGFPNRVYRRALCLVDTPAGVYLLDIFRMAGGTTRTFCAHGPGDSRLDCSVDFGEEIPGRWRPQNQVGRLPANIVNAASASGTASVLATWAVSGAAPGLRLHLTGAPGRRLIRAECAKPDIPAIRYLFAEDVGADGASEFVAVWEPIASGGVPAVTAVTRTEVHGGMDQDGFSPVALRVTLSNGRTDLFVYAPGNRSRLTLDGGHHCDGEFAYFPIGGAGDSACPAALMYGGTELAAGPVQLSSPHGGYSGRVVAVSWPDRTLTLDSPLPAGPDWTDCLIRFRHGSHRSAYHVVAISEDRRTVTLDCDGLIYRGTVIGVDVEAGQLTLEVPPRIPSGQAGYYAGAWLRDEAGTGCRVVDVRGSTLVVDRRVAGLAVDADGNDRRRVWIYDVGPGDSAEMKLSVCGEGP